MTERSTSALAVYSSRPTVRVEGQAYPKVTELVQSLLMSEGEGGMSSLELRLSNVASDAGGKAALAFDDERILKLGARLAIYAGDESAPREVFQGAITGLEADFPADGAPSLVVLAEDAFQRARLARRTRLHENVSIADLARRLASRLSLTPVVTALTDQIGTHVQLNESDLAFLRRILARYDADLQVVGTELHVAPRSDTRRGTIDLALHSQLRRARVLADLAHQVTQVTIGGWDVTQGRRVSGKGTGAKLGPGTGRSGARALQDALGARSEHLAHLAVGTAAEAQAVADATFDARARRFVTVEGTTEGNPSLRVGTNVALSGMGARFDNTYYVTQARHRFDQTRGYETDFSAECAFLGPAR